MPVRSVFENPVEQPDAGFFSSLGPALRTETAIGSVLSRERREFVSPFGIDTREPLDDDFFDTLETKYRPYAKSFSGARAADVEVIKRNIDDQIADREMLDRAGLAKSFAATAVVQFADPVNYIGGAAIKGPTLGHRIAQGAKSGLIGAALQEPILYGTQETRTTEESAINVGASVVFGSLLGAGVHAFSKAQRADFESAPYKTTVFADEEGLRQSLSAAVVDVLPEDAVKIDSAAQRAVVKATPGVTGPSIRLGKVESVPAKRIGLHLLENQFQVVGAEGGQIGQAAETQIKRLAGALEIKKERSLNDGFSAYIEETGGPSKFQPLARVKARREFSERVSDALRRGDLDTESEAVSAAARQLRSEVFEPILRDAQQAGLLPEGMTTKTAMSYFTRAWSPAALEAGQNDFIQITTDWFKRSIRETGLTNQDVAEYRLSDAQNRLRDATDIPDDATGRATIDDIQAELNNVSREAAALPKFPVANAVKKLGGIDPNSPIADELRAGGFEAKRLPGFFRSGGLKELDNIDPASAGLAGDLVRVGEDGLYLDRQDFIDAIIDEIGNQPRRTPDQEIMLSRLDELERLADDLSSGAKVRGGSRADIQAIEKEISELRAQATKAGDELADLDDQEIDFYSKEAAQGVWDTLTGNGSGFESPIVAVVQGPLKGRTFLIPDELVTRFMNNDAYEVTGQYIRTMTAEIELAKKFGRPDMRDQLAEVNRSYDDLVELNPDRSAELNKERKLAKETIEASRDVLRGTYLAKEHASPSGAVARALNAFNFVRMLGDVVLSSVPDMFRMGQVHGLQNLLGPDGVEAFMASVRAMRGSAEENALKREIEAAGIAETLLNSRIQGMADLYDPYAGAGPVESTMRAMANIGGIASGVNHWNQFWKQVAYQMGQSRFKRMASVDYDDLKPADRKYLKTLKVSKSNFYDISQQIKKHGRNDGAFDPQTDNWDNGYTAGVFRNALRADADSVIITPGAGDKPLIARHPLAAIPFQFKSFFLSAHQKALIRGMGEDQVNFLTGSAMMVAMGAAVYYLKSLSGNFDTSDNPGVWIAEGVDRSGIIAIAMELNNIQEPFTGKGVYTGLSEAFGDSSELSSRYRFRREGAMLGLIAGPSASTGEDATRVAGDLLRGDVKEGTVGAAGRLLPFANHPGIKQFMRYYAIPELKDAVN